MRWSLIASSPLSNTFRALSGILQQSWRSTSER
jgi:hypothetical protein